MNLEDSKTKTPVGWQGISLLVPVEWSLGAISGDRKSGYLRIDDSSMPRIEIKWSAATPDVDLDAILGRYLKEVEKSQRKKGPKNKLQTETHVRLVSKRHKRRKNIQGYSWKGDYAAHGLIWHCPQCNRVVIAQALSATQSHAATLASEILSTLEDHGDDGWDLWSVYGLKIELPEDFVLEHSKIHAGHTELSFSRGRHHRERIVISRWGMSKILLKEHALESWIREHCLKKYKGFVLNIQPAPEQNHPGLLIQGNRRRFLPVIVASLAKLTRRPTPPTLYCKAWNCEASNRIYSIECLLLKGSDFLAHEIVESVTCHDEE